MKRTHMTRHETEFEFIAGDGTSDSEGGSGETARRIDILSKLLRTLGATIIIAAAAIFLIQNWGYGDDIYRYLLLLGFTVVLSLGGFFCGLKLKENKGARTLLGLTIAVVPVHFAVLGGLLYSRFALDTAMTRLPGFATWVASDPLAAIAVTAGSVALLLPLIYLSTLVLGREGAKEVSAIFVIANALLLVPVRSPECIAVMTALLAAFLVWADVRFLHNRSGMKTLEGRFLRFMTVVPLCLIVARSFKFYIYSDLLLAVVLGTVAVVTFVLGQRLDIFESSKLKLQYASTVPAALGWFIVAKDILVSVSVSAEWILPLLTLPIAAILLVMSFFSVGDGSGFRRAGVIAAMVGTIANLVICPGLASSLSCLVVGVAAVIYGCLVEQKAVFMAGVLSIIFSLGYHMKYAVKLYSLSNWGVLAATGIVIIIVASLVERNHGQILARVAAMRKQIKSWDY